MNEASYVRVGGGMKVSTGHAVLYTIDLYETARAAGSLVQTDLQLPADARVERVLCTVTAAPVGLATAGSVASVRAANPFDAGAEAACTVDFGKLVTIGGIGWQDLLAAAPISQVYRWTGSTWARLGAGADFAETATERLLVESDDDGLDGDGLAELVLRNGGVRLPAVPSSLELLVDGVTVWFERQGSTPGTTPVPPTGGVAYVVDRTDLVRDAFDRAPPAAGRRTIRMALRSATPGVLTVAPQVASLRVHTVQFPPDGLARTVELAGEGRQSFDVSPPASATEVAEITMVVRGSFGPDRVQPAVGPDLQPDAHLVLTPARPVLLGLPTGLVARFAELGGVRLRLRTAPSGSGAELAGRLLADLDGRPGDPVSGGELTPLPVPAGADGWHTVSFAEPVRPPAPLPNQQVLAWLELHLSYGEAECALTLADPGDPAAPGAPLLRRLPGGGATALTLVPAIGVLHGALRLVGRPDRDRPIPAVTFAVPRSDTAIGLTPTGDDLLTVLALATPVRPADAPAGQRPVEMTAVVAAAGTLTVDTVQVAYREGAPS